MRETPAYLVRVAKWSLIVSVPLHAFMLFASTQRGSIGTELFVLLAGVLVLLLTQFVVWGLFISKREWRRSSGGHVWMLAFFPLLMAVLLVGATVLWEAVSNPPSGESYEPVIDASDV